MHNVEVVLVVAAPSLVSKGTFSFVLDHNRLITAPLGDDEISLLVAQDLFKKHTGFESGQWATLQRLPAVEGYSVNGKCCIALPYGCVIPEITTLRQGAWVALQEASQQLEPHDVAVLTHVIRNLR